MTENYRIIASLKYDVKNAGKMPSSNVFTLSSRSTFNRNGIKYLSS